MSFHMCRVDMERFEHVVCMKVLPLRSQETMSGRKEMIVIGSSTVYGEDIQSKGKVRDTTATRDRGARFQSRVQVKLSN